MIKGVYKEGFMGNRWQQTRVGPTITGGKTQNGGKNKMAGSQSLRNEKNRKPYKILQNTFEVESNYS